MGLKLPDETMRGFARTNRPIEVINAFVYPPYRGTGVGTLLLRHVEDAARQNGFTEIVVNSGPRYRETGWPFWIKRYGSAIGKADDYYGPGIHAPVWRKIL
jgi:GNAT superfamily N-acetyltransferase